MEQVKRMLLGNAFILIAISIHLFLMGGLLTDIFAIVGVVIVLNGYFSKSDEDS